MARRNRWILIGVLVVTIPLVIWALLQTPAGTPGRRRSGGTAPASVATPLARPTPAPTPVAIPPVEVEQTAISTVDTSGRKQWDIHAQTVLVDGAVGTANLNGVEGTYFQTGTPSVTFTAPRGIFYFNSRNITLTGGVHARATSGRTLDADVVHWFPKIHQIEATGSVVLRQKGLTVRADRLVADVSLQKTTLTGNIRVVAEEQ
jgi:LPS export ABC transporter protein LptC